MPFQAVMIKMLCKSILFLFIVAAGCQSACSQDIRFKRINPPKDPPLQGILGITQDPEGYLWIASNGLYKYDGHRYNYYSHDPANPNSLTSNRLETVFADKDGMIWISTYGYGLDRLDPVSNRFTHYDLRIHHQDDHESLLEDEVTSIISDHEGILWLGTMGGLVRFDPKKRSVTHFIHDSKDPASLSNNEVRVVYEDKQGTIWVGTGSPYFGENSAREGGLNKLDKKTGTFTRYIHDPKDPHSLIDNRVRAIFEDRRGAFWVGTAGDGLHTMDRKTGSFERHLYDPANPEKLSRPALKSTLNYADDYITFINEDNVGRIWIGTLENGINVYDPNTQKTVWYGKGLDSKEKLNDDGFWCNYITRDGIMWIGSQSASALYDINPYKSRLPYYYIGKKVYSLCEDESGSLWLATNKGLVHQGIDNKWESFYLQGNASGEKNLFYYFTKDNDNKFWLAYSKGGYDDGLYSFDPVKKIFKSYNHETIDPNSLLSDNVLFLKKGSPGQLLVGTDRGLDKLTTKSGAFKHFLNHVKDTASLNDLSNKSIKAIEIDKNNTIWLGTPFGVETIDEKTGHFKRILSNVKVYYLLNDISDNLWAATNNGLFKYDRSAGKFSLFSLEGTTVYFMTQDREKNLWLNTELGIVKLNLQNNETSIYGINEGVNPIALTGSSYTRHNGEIVFGNDSGYFAIQPDKLAHRTPAPSTIINQFFLADVPVAPSAGGILKEPVINTKEIRLKHSQSTFSFAFTVIDFVSAEEDVHSFYMLENYDGKWRKAALNEPLNYYNVPPGNYIFRVKSIDVDGQVSERHISVIVSPHWWQTWWAYSLFLLLMAGGVWAFVYYRSLALLKDKRILEHKVKIRTEEVMQQKGKIEVQRDELEKAFKELKMTQSQLIQSEKMASLGELTSGIAHEIQNPLNFVNNFSEVNTDILIELEDELRSGNISKALELSAEMKDNQGKIIHHGKRAESIVKGMLQHSKSGSGSKEPTNLNNLTEECLRLAFHGMQAKDKTFKAELTMHFDKSLPKINIVQQDISRVFLNLFNNAFYAVNQKMQKGDAGYVPAIEVKTSVLDQMIVLKVRDNGIGIPHSAKGKIMQPFFTTKPSGEGIGLGLSLSYDIVVKVYGGTIDVESVEGEFSEFCVKLPVAQ
jgi:signal transduction histidine kinase/ligand-binding sensor domain-containing protein